MRLRLMKNSKAPAAQKQNTWQDSWAIGLGLWAERKNDSANFR